MTKTVRVMFILRRSTIATPNNAECDKVSPKYARRRQTIKQPSGPASKATPVPPTTARIKKSSSMALHLDWVVGSFLELNTCILLPLVDLSDGFIRQMLVVMLVFIEC